MANMSLRLLGVVLLAAATWAQTAPAPPQPPAPAAAPQQSEPSTDQDQAQGQAEAEKAQAEAQKEAQKAAAQARQEAARARAETSKARKEAEKHRVVVMRESGSGSYLGVVDPRDVTSDRMTALKLKEERGVEASAVDRDSPAGKAGLKEHDVILSFNGQSIEGVEQLRRMLRETPAGRTVTLGISRNGQPMNIKVTLAKRPEAFAMGNFNSFTIPKMPPMDIDVPQIAVLQYSTRNGVMVEDLTTQLGEFFGLKDGQGALVRSVQKGSAADSAGLRAGDVIVKAGNEKITCSSDWRRILRDNKGGTLSVGVVRDKREQNVTLKLPEKQTSENQFRFQMEQLQNEPDGLQPELENGLVREMAAHRSEFEKLRLRMLRMQKDFQQGFQSQ